MPNDPQNIGSALAAGNPSASPANAPKRMTPMSEQQPPPQVEEELLQLENLRFHLDGKVYHYRPLKTIDLRDIALLLPYFGTCGVPRLNYDRGAYLRKFKLMRHFQEIPDGV